MTSLDLKVESPAAHKNISDQEDKAYQIKATVRSTLLLRKSPEERKLTVDFYNRIYASIEQEMLREVDPNSTACHDPYVEKLLEKLLVSIENDKNTCKYDVPTYTSCVSEW